MIPTCIICDKPAKQYSIKSKGYSKFCGKECQSISHSLQYIDQKYHSKEWWVDQRINQNKTIKQIHEETNLSEPLITRYLRRFNIVSNDERRPDSTTNDILESSEKLFDLYINQKLTVKQLAKKINSSPATVQRWLKHHNIARRAANSYKRSFVKQSKIEKEIYEFIQSIYSGIVETGNRSVLGSRELDIYIPDKNFAIEVHGLFYHSYYPEGKSEALRKDKYYHQEKTNKCESQGIYLMQIYEDEWKEKCDLFKSMIRSRLGLNENRIYARQCVVKHIDIDAKNNFLNQNHAQGKDKSSLKLGLFHNDCLIAVMTFVQNKFNKGYDWELNRFATLSNHTIVGGFSKLLKYATTHCNVSGTIVSYADRRYSQGNVYKTNGFTLTDIGRPGYYYIKKPNFNKRFNRIHGTKQNLAKLGGVGNTELEMAHSLGWRRIYDCGVLTYTLTT